MAASLAAEADVAGLMLLEAMIGDRAFTENTAAQPRRSPPGWTSVA